MEILEFFRKVLSFFEKEAPVAVAVCAAIPGLQLPAAAIALINAIPTLCQAAQQAIGSGAGTGALKADSVTTAVNAFIMTISKLNPSIDQKVWTQVAAVIPMAIETTITNVKLAQVQGETKVA
jgi:hypothetical protein